MIEPGVDARQFYDHSWPTPYSETSYESGEGFYYSPPVALLFAPFTTFGLPVFSAALVGIGLAALYAVAGRWAWALLFFPPVWWDISAGNINTLIGATVIIGASRPGLYAIPLLTKVTPGITVLWFALRREWRSLAIAALVTASLSVATLLIEPRLWIEWLQSLTRNAMSYPGPAIFAIDVPLLPRLLASVPLLVWGAATNRKWLLPVVAFLATPVLWYSTGAILVAVLAGVQNEGRRPT